MKIKNKFIIPVIAVLVALIMTGAPVATVAADTEASDSTSATTRHPYDTTVIPYPTTSSLDEEIDAIVSDVLGPTAGELGGPIRDTIETSGGFLRAMKAFIDKLIEFTKKIGDFLSGFTLRDLIGGSTTTTAPAEESTTAAQ